MVSIMDDNDDLWTNRIGLFHIITIFRNNNLKKFRNFILIFNVNFKYLIKTKIYLKYNNYKTLKLMIYYLL